MPSETPSPSSNGKQMTHKLPRDKRQKIPKSKRHGYAKAAAKCGNGKLRDAITTTWTATEQAKHKRRKLGSFGAASPVVRIDPETMLPITPDKDETE